MAVNIGPKIGIEGEKEYRQQINQIIQQAKTLDSEMKLVASSFDDATTAEEKNAATGKVLVKQIDVQRQRVQALSDMLEKSAAMYGENDVKTLKWQQSVNEATARLNNMEKGLGSTTKETTGLGDAVEAITGKLNISLPDGITKTLNGLGSMSSGLLAAATACAAVVTAIVAVEKALIDMTQAQAEAARETENLAQTMGMTTTEYQEWDYILKSVGYSAEQAQGDLSMLAERAMDAAEGVGEGAELFNKLGINVKNSQGVLKSQSELFTEVVDKLSKMTDETERNAIASALLNTTGEKLVPLLNATSGELENMRQRAHDLGVVLSEEDVAALSELSRTTQDFQAAGDGLQKMISAKMAPALDNLLEKGASMVQGLTDLLAKSGLIEVFAALLDIVAALSPVFEVLFDTAGEGVGPFQSLAVALAIVADALSLVANLIALVIEGLRQLVKLFTGDASTAKLQQYADNLNRIFSAEGATARAISSMASSRSSSSSVSSSAWSGGLSSGTYSTNSSYPSGINTAAGYAAYQKKLAEDERLAALHGSYGDTYNINIDAKNVSEFNDIVRIAQNERVNRRAGYAGG